MTNYTFYFLNEDLGWSKIEKIEKFEYTNNTIQYPAFFISSKSWNDYGYYTKFSLTYKKNKNDEVTELGDIKIIMANKEKEFKTQLPTSFKSLNKNKYLSIGNKRLYQTMNECFKDSEETKFILKKLNEYYVNDYSRNKILNLNPNFQEPFDYSLMRRDGTETSIFFDIPNDLVSIKDLILRDIDDPDSNDQDIIKKNLFYAQLIILFESYLSEKCKYEILNSLLYKTNFMKYYKIRLVDKSLFDLSNMNIDNELKIILNNIIFHNIQKVREIYKKTFKIDISENIDKFSETIQNRHIIVHNCGIKPDGTRLIFRKKDLINLAEDIENSIIDINHKFALNKD